MARPRHGCFVLASVLFSLALTLMLLELAVRVASPVELMVEPKMFTLDPRCGYRLKSNYMSPFNTTEFRTTVRTNSLGMREAEFTPADRARGRRVILGIGDSFTFGYGVDGDSTWLAVLERLLGVDAVRVLNAGVGGYSTFNERRWLETYGDSCAPHEVLVGFCISNDVDTDVLNAPALDLSASLAYRLKVAFNENCKLYIFLKNRLKRSVGLSRLLQRLGLMAPQHVASGLYVFRKAPDPLVEEQWALTLGHLAAMRDLARDSWHAPLRVVLIPTREQVYPERWPAAAARLGLDPAEYDLERPDSRVVEFCVREKIPCLDLLPGLREAARADSGLYFRYDAHWTPAGHEAAARLIAAWMGGGRAR